MRPIDSNLAPRESSIQYQVGEALYGAVAVRCLKRGWTLIPQERDEKRRTSLIDKHALKWGAYKDAAPTVDEVEHWARQAPTSNGAVLLGKPSGLVWVLDIDVTDPKFSGEIQRLADEILGATPFARSGQRPKIAFFYRAASEEQLPPNRSWKFLDEEHANPGHDGLEILAAGKMITCFGYHWKTEKYFQWEGAQPGLNSTDEVPVVTLAQLEHFIAAVQDLRPFHRNGFKQPSIEELAADGDDVRVPKFALNDNFSQWVEDPTSGKIVDGREAFLWSLALSVARGNAHLVSTDAGIAQMRARVLEQFTNNAELSGKWTEGYAKREVFEKVGRAARDVRDGRVEPLRSADLGLKKQEAPRSEYKSLAIAKRRVQVTAEFEEIYEAEKAKRKLNLDRAAVGERTQSAIETALRAAMDAVYDDRNEEVHVIPGATGSGKTSRTIQLIAEDPRTKSDDMLPPDSEDRRGPWLVVLPTYNNVAELKSRAEILGLDPTLDDDELVARAAARGVHLEGSTAIANARAQALDAGLRVEVYKGKLAAGCQMEEVVKPLMQAGIRTGALCKTKRMTAGKPEEVLCQHYATCPAILQRKAIADAHLVIVVQSFLTLAIPEELKRVRGVVLDERIFHLVLHGTTMQLRTLQTPRREPKLTKAEEKAGLSPLDLVQDREQAAEMATMALRTGKDVANAFFDVESLLTQADLALRPGELASKRSALRSKRLALIESAKRVTGSGMAIEQAVYPGMTVAAVQKILDRPTGTEIAQEWRFWQVVANRFVALVADEQARIMSELTIDPPAQRAHGETDSRLQYLHPSEHQESVRISWVDDMNWTDKVRILLDASMDPEITRRLFPDSNVVMHSVDTDLNLRTIYAADQNWAISGLIPRADTKGPALVGMAKRIDNLRLLIARYAGLNAHGCVSVKLPKALRDVVQIGWQAPYNVDFGHHGAVKGLDYARRHVAQLVIGRLEPPTEAIDAQVGALTNRDAVPEQPIDKLGTGVDQNGRDVGAIRVPRRVKLRDRDAIISSTEYTGQLASRLQRQYREEESRQIIGRLRPIYRDDTPETVVLGQSLPEDIIVDVLTTADALMADLAFWDLVRRTGGIIDVEAMARRSITGLTVEHVQSLFDRLTDRDEVLKRYHRVTSKSPDGRVSQWWLPGYFSHLEAEVREYAQSCAPHDTILTIGMCEMTVMPAGRAPMDAINEAAGDAVAQRAAEAAALKPVVEMVMRRGEWKTGPMALLFRAGQGDLEREHASLGAWTIVNRWLAERAPKEDAPAEVVPVVVATTDHTQKTKPLAEGEEPWQWWGREFG